MVGEAQFTQWRKDLMENLRKAGKAIEDDDVERKELAILAMNLTSQVMMAERIGMLAIALNRNDEVISELMDRIGIGEQIAERLIDAAEKMEDLPEEMGLHVSFLENWIHPEGPVKFSPPSRS